MTDDSNQIIAYEMEVEGAFRDGFSTHYLSADEVPENPEDAWRDDHRVRNIRPLTYLDQDEDEGDSE